MHTAKTATRDLHEARPPIVSLDICRLDTGDINFLNESLGLIAQYNCLSYYAHLHQIAYHKCARASIVSIQDTRIVKADDRNITSALTYHLDDRWADLFCLACGPGGTASQPERRSTNGIR